MPITVSVKEYGTEIDFPDGMSNDQIQAVLQKHFPVKNDNAQIISQLQAKGITPPTTEQLQQAHEAKLQAEYDSQQQAYLKQTPQERMAQVQQNVAGATDQVKEAIGLNNDYGKVGNFARNINRGFVDLAVGFPMQVAAGVTTIPQEVKIAAENPAQYAGEVGKDTARNLLAPIDPREYTLDKLYQDPVGRAMLFGQAVGLGLGVKNTLGRPKPTPKFTGFDPRVPDATPALPAPAERLALPEGPKVLTLPAPTSGLLIEAPKTQALDVSGINKMVREMVPGAEKPLAPKVTAVLPGATGIMMDPPPAFQSPKTPAAFSYTPEAVAPFEKRLVRNFETATESPIENPLAAEGLSVPEHLRQTNPTGFKTSVVNLEEIPVHQMRVSKSGAVQSINEISDGELLKRSFGDVGQIFKNDRGSISGKDITPEQKNIISRSQEARGELFRRTQERAKRLGISIEEAFADMGMASDQIRLMLQSQAGKSENASRETVPAGFAGTNLNTGKTVNDRVAFRPDKIASDQDVIDIIGSTAKENNQFSAQRTSKSDIDIQELAKLVDVTPEALMKQAPGSIANAETVFKARQVVNSLAEDLRNTAREITTETATPEQLQAFKEKMLRLQGSMKAVAGFRTEASHVFRQFRTKASAAETEMMRELLSEIKKVDAGAADDIAAFTRKSKQLVQPTGIDKAWHLWYANILSGPSTHLKNLIGNTSQLLLETSRVAATQPTELPTAIRGLWDGLVKGAGEGKQILKEGDTSKFEARGMLPIKFTGKASILNAADYVGRALSAADAVFREGHRGMETRSLARAQAIKEGLRGGARRARTEELSRSPTQEIVEQADQWAQRGTYTQEPEGVLGAVADAVSRATRPGSKGESLRFIVPFTRVVANVVNNAIDWTPLGFKRAAMPRGTMGTARALSQGEPINIKTGRQTYQQIGRATLGTVAMVYFASLAEQGNLTGDGPRDVNKKRQLMASGWKPNSIKVGDTYVPFSHYSGPVALNMALVGNYYDAVRYGDLPEDDATQRLAAAMLGSANTILDMSFLRGVGDLFTAINQSDTSGPKKAQGIVSNLATSAVPNLYKQVARYFDPTVYDTKTIGEQIQSSIRITSGLKPQVDIFGDPIVGDRLTGLSPSKKSSDPVKTYLAENNLWVSTPRKTTKIYDEKLDADREMTRDEYYNYVKFSGQQIKETLAEDISYLKGMETQEERQDYLNKLVDKIRKAVKKDIEFGDIK